MCYDIILCSASQCVNITEQGNDLANSINHYFCRIESSEKYKKMGNCMFTKGCDYAQMSPDAIARLAVYDEQQMLNKKSKFKSRQFQI